MPQKEESLLAKSITAETAEKSYLVGLGLIFIGGLCSVICNFLVKLLEDENIPLEQIIWARSLVLFILVGVFILFGKVHGSSMTFFGPKKFHVMWVIRAVIYFIYLCSIYWALKYISVSLTLTILYTFPIFTAILSQWGCCIEPEKLSKFGWLCTLASFSGIFCDLYFSGNGGAHLAGIILAMTASISYTFQVIIIRRTKDAHWSEMEFFPAFVWSFVLTPCALIWKYIFNTVTHDHGNIILKFNMEPHWWLVLIGMAVLNVIVICSITIGFQFEEAPKGTIIMYLDIPIYIAFEYVLFDREVTWIEICGVSLAVIGAIGISAEKILKRRRHRLLTIQTLQTAF